MGQPRLKNEKYTIEEWQKLEQSGDIRYEFHFGEVFAMASLLLPLPCLLGLLCFWHGRKMGLVESEMN